MKNGTYDLIRREYSYRCWHKALKFKKNIYVCKIVRRLVNNDPTF